MIAALCLTIASAFTPGWRQIESRYNNTESNRPDGAVSNTNAGLFSFLCVTPGEDSKSNAKTADEATEYCKNWWKVSSADAYG